MGNKLRLSKVGASLLYIFTMLLFLVFSFNLTSAQDSSDAITLGVSPQILEITANPGEKVTNTFRLTNASEQSVNIKTIPKNFTPLGEEGAVDLTEDSTNFSLAEWVTVSPDTALLDSNTTKDFVVTINVPEDVEPGSHFGSVVFQTIPPEDDTAAALVSQEIAPVILVKVAGDITETAEIVEFKSTKSFWSNESSISLISRITNTGTAHFKPTGQIVIKNMFGSEVAKLELDKRNVLPGSIRQFTNEWQTDGFKLGRYTAELTLVTGEDDKIQTSTTSFTIFPYQVVIPVVILLSILVFIIFKGRKRLAKAAKALSGKDIDTKEK
jgi:hypothetical protein